MGLFKERICSNCGKKAGRLTGNSFKDGYLCYDCFDEYCSPLLHEANENDISRDWTIADANAYLEYVKGMTNIEFNPEYQLFDGEAMYDIACGCIKFKKYPDILSEDIFEFVIYDIEASDAKEAKITLTFITNSKYYPKFTITYKMKKKMLEGKKDFRNRISQSILAADTYLELLEPVMSTKEYRKYLKKNKA